MPMRRRRATCGALISFWARGRCQPPNWTIASIATGSVLRAGGSAARRRRGNDARGGTSSRQVAQRRADRERGQPIVRSGGTSASARRPTGRGSWRRPRAYVVRRGRVSPTRDLVLLQHAEELRLHRERHLADLVEQDRAAARRLEEPTVVLARAGERPAPMAEELALEQRLRQGGAVDGDERSVRAWARAMDAARDELLAGAGLTLDQHGDRGAGRALHQPEHLGHDRARATKSLNRPRRASRAGGRSPARRRVRHLQVVVAARVVDRDGDARRGDSSRSRSASSNAVPPRCSRTGRRRRAVGPGGAAMMPLR
jgi:hypothetical protein